MGKENGKNILNKGEEMTYWVKDSLKALGVFIIGAALIIMLVMVWLDPIDTTKIQEPFDEMQFVGSVKDGQDMFIVYLDKAECVRWFSVIVISEDVYYISEYPALIENNDKLLIRVRWSPNKYVDCKRFLEIAGSNLEAFCQRYHLPTNKIRAVCGGF